MTVIREFVKAVDHKIVIEIPDEFRKENEFEVIIMPSGKNKNSMDDFFNLAGKIDIDEAAIDKLREDSCL